MSVCCISNSGIETYSYKDRLELIFVDHTEEEIRTHVFSGMKYPNLMFFTRDNIGNSKNIELRVRNDSSCQTVHARHLLGELNVLLEATHRQATLVTTPTTQTSNNTTYQTHATNIRSDEKM